MVPIIIRLKKDNPGILIQCIVSDLLNTYASDYRIKYLIQNNVEIHHIIDFLGYSSSFKKLYHTINYRKSKKKYSSLYEIFIKITSRIFVILIKKKIDKTPASFIVKQILKNSKSIFVFDQSFNPFYEKIGKYLNHNNIISIAVPHGHNIIANQMISTELLDIEYKKGHHNHSVFFDYVIFANQKTADKWIDYGYVKSEKIKVLGSSRFCDEWTDKNKEIIPKNNLPSLANKILKVVVMLTKSNYNIFTDEVNRNIQFISSFPNVYVIVKPHTRGQTLNNFKFKDNVEVVDNSYYSTNLIEWSDILFFTASSIIFESLKMNKPTIYMKNAHSNKLLYEDFFKFLCIECRDDLRDLMWNFISDKNFYNFSKVDKDNYLKNLIEPSGPEVLKYYSEFLIQQFN